MIAILKSQQCIQGGKVVEVMDKITDIEGSEFDTADYFYLDRYCAMRKLRVYRKPCNSNELFNYRCAINALVAIASA